MANTTVLKETLPVGANNPAAYGELIRAKTAERASRNVGAFIRTLRIGRLPIRHEL